MGSGPQLLRHQPDIFVGLVIAGGDAGVSHQRADVGDGAFRLGIFLQPGHQLSDQIAPAHSQTAGADLPQQIHGPLGEQLVGGVVICALLHQDAAADGMGPLQLFQQPGCLGARFVDHDLHHAKLPGLGEHTADHRTGYAQLPGNVALPLILQIIPAGHIRQLLLLFQTDLHKNASH